MKSHLKLEDIVQGCVDKNKESQSILYNYFYTFSLNTCLAYCTSVDEVQEIINDGFLKIFNNVQNFTARYNNFEVSMKSWIKKIMINAAINHYHKYRQHCYINKYDGVFHEIISSDRYVTDKIYYKDILKFIQQLSPVYQLVLFLYVVQGFKHEEIAKVLNISIGTSKSNLAKARINMQKMLEHAYA